MFNIKLIKDAAAQLEMLNDQLKECDDHREREEIKETIKDLNKKHKKVATRIWIKKGSVVGQTIVLKNSRKLLDFS